MRRVKVTFVGPEHYGSIDRWDGGRSIELDPGQWTAVSESKAEQLAADFPGWFEFGETIGTDDASVAIALAEKNELERAQLDREAQEARERDRLRQIEEDARLGELVRLREEAETAAVRTAEAHADETVAEVERLEAEDVAVAAEEHESAVESELAEAADAAPPRTRARAGRKR